MNTLHKTLFKDSSDLSVIDDNSIDLVITSPPYPMIEMWDSMFIESGCINKSSIDNSAEEAFECMHKYLDKVWRELIRVVKEGGLICINIGDAVRTINGRFQIYMNHARIIQFFTNNSISILPTILWRKQTNAPNKFMGSGMLPAGAYVTLEHEHILVFRKGDKRIFASKAEKDNRQSSAYFWEERNTWFSDVWDFKGTRQNYKLPNGKSKTAAFPFELPFRIINMYSVKGDTVLDPFLGTGTTMVASIAAGRNSIGVEIDAKLIDEINNSVINNLELLKVRVLQRIWDHREFVINRNNNEKAKKIKHASSRYGFPVMTKQEINLVLTIPVAIDLKADGTFIATHEEIEIMS